MSYSDMPALIRMRSAHIRIHWTAMTTCSAYYIRFQDPYAGYQYEINAISGEIIDFSVTLK